MNEFDKKFFNGQGRPGLQWSIDGEGFGTEMGTVTMSEKALPIAAWSDAHVSGEWPGDVAEGPVTLTTADGRVLTGHFSN